ncbi:MAG TPA: substrate-binding domain-containing protein [Polyangiaceae bacterium]|jgi:DNA-binding LacI/PurR family transcriptional regulator/signal transduction histidine kinase/CheY-like chemotaxis protein|nr:substrate-binding domain-containing protein [Polyangiaceae bacterium]
MADTASLEPDVRAATGVRRTIGVLVDYIDSWQGGYETQLRGAFEAECRRLDLNLLLIVGRSAEHTDAAGRAHNEIYRLINAQHIDGLILVSSVLAAFSGREGVERLCRSLPKLPMCSIGLELTDVPSVILDNRAGMVSLMDHLLAEHSRQRIAFIGGPLHSPDACVRMDVYLEALQSARLPIDPKLLVAADFSRGGGMDAMKQILASGASFDAVVAANDAMALGALDVLKSMGCRVPRDVAVTGFDDLTLSRYAAVPLTTVRQPMEYMASVALRSVYRQLQGKSVDPVRRLVAEFIQRQSCGCGPKRLVRPEVTQPSALGPARFVDRHADRLSEVLIREVELPGADPGWARQLVVALREELTGKVDAFINVLDDLLNGVGPHDELYDEFQLVITLLRDALTDVTDSKLEDLWHVARRAIALASIRNQTGQRMDAEASYQRLLGTGERFTAALDRASLLKAFAEELPRLNARDVFVSLFADDTRQRLQPFFWMQDGKVREVPFESFDAQQLIPNPDYWQERRRTSFALPLTFEAECFGVVVFGEGTGVYEMLREQISAAIKVNALHQEIVRQTALRERSVQERVATGERMQALSVLAGGVAHDLNNALGPLVGLPDMILTDLARVERGDWERLAQARADIGMIKAAAQRAALTIKDLLTLGRRGKGAREPIDLNDVIRQCIASELIMRHATEAGVELTVQLAELRMGVLGSEPHLVRVVSNLLRNALEATQNGGRIVIATSVADVVQPRHGYETVEPGCYSVLSVVDTGHGMTREDVARAFEPFFSKKRFAGRSGSGLGLAIVHAVVKEHGGFIHVESDVGKGTGFTLYLPRVELESLPEPIPTEPPRGGGRLLIIDDEPAQLRTAARALIELGYDVTTALSGKQALAHLGMSGGAPHPEDIGDSSASAFDLVICDVLLGEAEDGIDLLKKVLQRYPKQKTLIVSGYASEERRQVANALGIPWVAKPYTTQTLADAVDAVIKDKTGSGQWAFLRA